MATALNAFEAAAAGRPLTLEERALYVRYALGGGSGSEKFFNADGTLNLQSQQGPGVTTGQFVARVLGNPSLRDYYGGLGTPNLAQEVAQGSNVVQGLSATLQGLTYVPPLPHPDASNLALGPNLGGSDAVTLPGDSAGMPGGSGAPVGQGVGGLLLAGGVVLLVLLAFRGK